MHYYFCLLLLWSTTLQGQATEWNTLQQEFLGLTYLLPQSWYVGGHAPPKACACAAATVNTTPDGQLSIIIAHGEAATLEQASVWGYHFVPVVAPRGFFEQDHFAFTESVSTWAEAPEEEVWRYSGLAPSGKRYVVYIWGTPKVVQQYRPDWEHILRSIRPL